MKSKYTFELGGLQKSGGDITKAEVEQMLLNKSNIDLDNISAEGSQKIKETATAVSYNHQELTDLQKSQARQNIDAADTEELNNLKQKVSDIELFKFPNATIIGEPTIQSGQVSDFSTASYLQFPFILDFHDRAFQIDFCFTTATNVQTQQNILDSKFGLALAIANGKGVMSISSNGTEWNIGSVVGTMDLQSNTTYYARLIWNKLQYKTFLSTDGVNYTQDMVITSATRPYPTTIFIGGCDQIETGHTPHPFLGTINMNKAFITVMNNVIWQGMDDVGLATRLATDLSNITEDGEQKINEVVKSGGGVVKTTYAELKTLHDNGELKAGTWYRITDYECTTTQESTQSAGHVFDILVQAIDGSTLSELAKAAIHEGDVYFDGCNLNAWQLWYSLDNDTKRFLWADEENGKGVIYRMIDEWNNDCHYDFKNIQFLRTITDGAYDEDGEEMYVYTFTAYDRDNGEYMDAWKSIGRAAEDASCACYSNVIKPLSFGYDRGAESLCYRLNNIVFMNIFSDDDSYYYECSRNTFGNYCYSNTFGNYCSYNTFGNNCYYNTFGDDCNSNTFGNDCNSNTFGNNCYSNTFGNNCYSNTFGNKCYSNTFGNNFFSNTFGNNFSSNTFGNNFSSNTFGNSCYSNTFGNSCYSNTFGNSCSSNTFGNDCYYNTFGNTSQNNELQGYLKNCTIHDGVQYILIPSGTSSQQKQFCVVYNGTSGTSSSNKLTINFENGKNYPQFAAKKSDGSLEIWTR